MSFHDFSDKGAPPSGIPSGGGPAPMMMPMQAHDPAEALIDYNERFGSAEATLYRDDVIAQTMSVLIGHNKPNALLVGPAGVGKTKIVEDIARRLATSDPSIPPTLARHTIYELPLSSIVSGSGIVGELEAKCEAIIDFASDPENKAILFIDEVHLLVKRHGPYETIAQILKPALARADIHLIGATTTQEAGDLADDPALSRRMTRIIVDELTTEQTVDILSKGWPALSAHYNHAITIDDTTFELVTTIANQYATAAQHRPDSALTLLDRVCGDAIVERSRKLASVADQPQVASALAATPITVNERDARRCAMKLITGQSRRTDVDKDALDADLSHILGQDDVIGRVRRLVELYELDLFPRTRPLTILCAGPSGVGKSAIAKIVAENVTGCTPITLNMTEFNSPASINRIIGSPRGYIGSDSHGELPFDLLDTNPYQVILLDEMEKADRAVQRLFMSVFDEGYLKTNAGKRIDFSKSIIFVTTNAAHTAGAHATAGFTAEATRSDAETVGDLSQFFDVELLNRFEHIITFSTISRDMYRAILADKYETMAEEVRATHPRLRMPQTLDDATLDELAESYIEKFGARPAERTVKRYIEDLATA